MFDSFALNPDSFISSSKSFDAYERQQQLLNPPRVHEGFLVRTGAISQGQTKEISFAGIPFDFRLMSVWVWMPGATDNDGIEISILYSGIEQTRFDLRKQDVPWEPPFNILGANHSINIKPDRAVASISLFIQQAKLLDVEGV
ncbi:hypothetical protein Lepto7376_3719 [[Leptolyngbya] sp. PCC 7376]|uniref:hypothetical protein n=1 Tax=[Leptolyngbya] sp. PCC 7376 TaxID=111781 RepID=UPI00029EEED2|nr:hypothetical protein [[Leptolyngbya] sp. PCC 7376]AFY39895.1 hypothetical protein Lepto7376_3719 [[Leptolyngbya] sp. PCC 7376]